MTLNLTLPQRPDKPRSRGRTQILDKGMGLMATRDFLDVAAGMVDLVKLGWGTSIVTPNVGAKVNLYREYGVDVCLGGTLLELVFLQDKVEELTEWLLELGISTVEVSDGVVHITPEEKATLISRLAKEFTVLSEVGSKDTTAIVTPARWVEEIRRDLEAGSSSVILEGRESGTGGLYRESGEIRMGLVDEILDADIPQERLVFEAPNKVNQVWLIRHLGPSVNLANIRPEDAVPVETLRLGLRADTLLDLHR